MKFLFICSQNRRRSLTAERLFDGVAGHQARSAGTEQGARIRVTAGHIGWADCIFVMERRHADRLRAKFRQELAGKRVICLHIPDDYGYMDDALIMLSATGRKYLRGPRGTGFLYVRRAWLERLEPPLIDLHAATWTGRDTYTLRPDARRFENWESNIAAKIGLGVAVDYALSWGLDAIWARVAELAERLRTLLREVPGVVVHDLGAVRCGIVTFTLAGRAAAEIREALHAQGINVSVSTRSSTRLDMEARALDAVVRASVHYYNSDEELAQLCDALDASATAR